MKSRGTLVVDPFCQWLVTLCLTLELVRHRWCSSTIWETSQGVMLRLPGPVGEVDVTVLCYCYSLLLESTASFRAVVRSGSNSPSPLPVLSFMYR